MQVRDALSQRRSVRAFSSKRLEPKLIEEIVDAGRLAATARNVQPWEFVAVTKKETLQQIAAIAETGRFIAQAPSCIAVFSQDTKYYLEDCSAATENILIAAYGLGLVSCWVAGDKKPYCEDIRKLLAVPEGFKLVSLIALGHTDTPVEMPKKRALKEVLHWEKF